MHPLKQVELEAELNEAIRNFTYATTAMRNAIQEIMDGDYEDAIETLQQIVGK